ncbi:type IV toxin-antitoxin system AbiEi family antitoxin [Streptomyces sp. M10(2022)]
MAWLRLNPAIPAWQRPLGDEHSGWVSHASACELHGIGDLPADTVQILVPRRRTTREPGVRLRRAEVAPRDATVVDGLPVTTVERTICDLLADRVDAGHIGGVLADADRMGLVDTRRLADRTRLYVRSYGLPRGKTGADLLSTLVASAGYVLREEPPSETASPGENARGVA